MPFLENSTFGVFIRAVDAARIFSMWKSEKIFNSDEKIKIYFSDP